MNPLTNLSVIRKLVQVGTFLLFVYGGSMGGYYLADKFSIALPALSCAYDSQSADLCVLIPFQHQMHHRLGMAIAGGGNLLMGLMPTLITLGLFVLLFAILNKAFCGWVCPLGTFQEFMHLLGQKLGLQRHESLDQSMVKRYRPVKWLILVFLVFVVPLLAGIGLLGDDFGDSYCRICPSRILTSLATGDSTQLFVDTANNTTLVLSLIGVFLFGLMTTLALTVRQPFCRICPLLALHAVFRKLGLLRLVKNATPRCDRCGLCTKACPMDIKAIHTEMEKKDLTTEDCTLCGRCVEFCPDKDVLQLKYAMLPVFSADPQYFKKRKKAQKDWEASNLTTLSKKRDASTDVKPG